MSRCGGRGRPGPAPATGRLVRIFDEDTVTFELALDACSWHFQQSKVLSGRPPRRGAHRADKRWPMKGLPILGVGAYAGSELVI
jgi:hypothetical protein